MTIFCPAQALSQDQVVAAIYETMIRTEQFDRFSSTLQPGMAGAERTGNGSPIEHSKPSPVLRAHFARAAEIQELQWDRAGRPHPGEFSGVCNRFWMLAAVDGDIRLLNASQRASRQLARNTHLPDAMELTNASSERWSSFLEQVREGACSWQDVLVLSSRRPGERYLCRPVRLSGASGKKAAVMAERFDCEWSNQAVGPITAAFGLQKLDLEPLKAVLSGPGRGLVAGMEQTIARTGAPGLAELIRLTAFLMNEHVRDLKIARGELLPPSEEVQDSGGRTIQYFRLGAETGQPVIYIHGILDGIAPLQRLQPQLRNLGFRVYAPMRGGYGGSPPLAHDQDPADALSISWMR